MHVLFAALFFFAILTLWVPGYWPVTIFQVGIFTLTGVAVWRARVSPPAFAWPVVPLFFAVLLGLAQLLSGRTAYAFATKLATVRWATFLSVFIVGISLFRDAAILRWFRSALIWFAFVVAIFATIQAFSSSGKVFWLFDTPNVAYVMGPILSRNHYAAFIEAVLPIAVYTAVRRGRESLLYSGMAAAMYASVIASSSRAGIVLATAEIILVPLLMWARLLATGRNAAAAAVRMGAMLAVFTAIVGWNSAWGRLWMPDPFTMRRELAISTLHMSRSHLWLGAGLGTWPVVYPQYAVIDVGIFANQAHSDWLQWTAEGGLPFGIMLASLFIWSLRPAFRSVWGLGVLAVFLHAMVDYPFSRPALGAWPILVLSMVVAAAESRHSAARSSHGAAPY
jgi:hypothetical protein